MVAMCLYLMQHAVAALGMLGGV